jgi:hypothetical protein
MRFENTGNSMGTPFVYFVSGIPVYPPNTIYESTKAALSTAGLFHEGLRDLAKTGNVGGTWAVLPEAWWYHFLMSYKNSFGNNSAEPAKMEHSAVESLKLMTTTPPDVAWRHLVAYIIAEIDNLSGWTNSWIKQSADERKVSKGEDGNYYYHDFDGTLIQIHGEKTTSETHL